MIRTNSILTSKNNLETLDIIKKFPVSMSTVPMEYDNFKYMDMIYTICKDTGIIQIKNYPTLEDMYPFQHNFSYGSLWENLFIKFTEIITSYLKDKHKLKIIEIGGSECKLANKLLEKNKNIDSYNIFEKNCKRKNLNSKIKVIDEYFSKNSKILNKPDLIIHSHLLEHIWDPVEFIKTIKENLNNNSYHFFIVPNIMQLFSKKFTNSLNFEHNFFIIEDYVDIILNNNGFTILNKEYYLDHSIMYFTILKNNNIIYKSFPNLYQQNKKLVIDFFDYHKKLVKDINSKTKNFEGEIYLFGAHIFSQYLICFGLDISKVKCILDNCDNKNKTRMYGTNFIVEFPSIISNKNNVGVILKVANYQETIKKQLKDINSKVIIFD